MIKRLLKVILKLLWLLPGFLLWATFPPMGEATDCLFALAPLVWVARQKSPREAARIWFINGFLFWFATLVWMPAIVKNGGPWYLVLLGWLGLAAYCALYFAAFGYLAAQLWKWAEGEDGVRFPSATNLYLRRLGIILLGEPILWAGLEWVRGTFGGGFAWNQLGTALAQTGFGAPAALGGVALLSGIVILVNGTIVSFIQRVWKPADLGVPKFVRIAETLLPLLLIWGIYTAEQHCRPSAATDDESLLTVGLVQRNFPCVFRAAEENPTEIYQELMTSLRPFECDLVILPESAMGEWGRVDGRHAEAFAAWALRHAGAKALLAGGERRTDAALYNSAALYQAGATNASSLAVSIYDKVHLVPFGEYIPGDKTLTFLQRLAPVGSCTAGELKLLNLETRQKTIPFGVSICYEDTDSALIRKQAKLGARFLVFITNDSWFSHSIEPLQHAWQSVARAIETGLPVARVGNSGVSGIILPNGRAYWMKRENGVPLVDKCAAQAEVLPVSTSAPTLYTRLGNAPLVIAFILLLLFLALVKIHKRYQFRKMQMT